MIYHWAELQAVGTWPCCDLILYLFVGTISLNLLIRKVFPDKKKWNRYMYFKKNIPYRCMHFVRSATYMHVPRDRICILYCLLSHWRNNLYLIYRVTRGYEHKNKSKCNSSIQLYMNFFLQISIYKYKCILKYFQVTVGLKLIEDEESHYNSWLMKALLTYYPIVSQGSNMIIYKEFESKFTGFPGI